MKLSRALLAAGWLSALAAPACVSPGDDSAEAAARRPLSLPTLAQSCTYTRAVAFEAETLARPISSAAELSGLRAEGDRRIADADAAYERAILTEGARVRVAFRTTEDRWDDSTLEVDVGEYAFHALHSRSPKVLAELDEFLESTHAAAPASSPVWRTSPVARVILEAEAARRVVVAGASAAAAQPLDFDENIARARQILASVGLDPDQDRAIQAILAETKGDPAAFFEKAVLVQGVTNVALAAALLVSVVEAGPEALKELGEGRFRRALETIGSPLLTLAAFSSLGQGMSWAAVKLGFFTAGRVVPFFGVVVSFAQAYAFAHQDHTGPSWITATETVGVTTQTIGSLLAAGDLLLTGTISMAANVIIAIGGAIWAGGILLEREASRRQRFDDIAAVLQGAGIAPASARAIAHSARGERPASLMACFGWSPAYVRAEASNLPFVFSSSDSMAGMCRFAREFGLVSGPVGAAKDTGIGAALHDPKVGKSLWEQANVMSASVEGRDAWCRAFSTKVLGIGAPLNAPAYERFCR